VACERCDKLELALGRVLAASLCDLCYDAGCTGSDDGFCSCRGACHDRRRKARDEAMRLLHPEGAARKESL
jgi:hypothetical protein